MNVMTCKINVSSNSTDTFLTLNDELDESVTWVSILRPVVWVLCLTQTLSEQNWSSQRRTWGCRCVLASAGSSSKVFLLPVKASQPIPSRHTELRPTPSAGPPPSSGYRSSVWLCVAAHDTGIIQRTPEIIRRMPAMMLAFALDPWSSMQLVHFPPAREIMIPKSPVRMEMMIMARPAWRSELSASMES